MKILRLTMIACLLSVAVAGTARASSENVYVCSVRIDTGLVKEGDTALPSTRVVQLEVELRTQPYCQGSPVKSIQLMAPTLEKVRDRKKGLVHVGLVRNALQGVLSSFLTFEIAAAQGLPLNRPIVLATEEPAKQPNDYAVQASRPASIDKYDKAPVTGQKTATGASGYVCLARSRYLLDDSHEIVTVADIHNFEVHLFSEPYCRGREVFRREYEFGPPMKRSRDRAAAMFELTANTNAAAVMHAVHVALVEASSAGQLVTVTHAGEQISSLVIRARPRDLVKEVKTIAQPGG